MDKHIVHCKISPVFKWSSFDDLTRENISNNIEKKSYRITSTRDLYEKIAELMGVPEGGILNVNNVMYDKDTVTQSLTFDDDELNQIFVKRKIDTENFTYTFMEYSHDKDFDYQYLNITDDDVINIIRYKYIHKGLHLLTDGTAEEMEYILNFDNNEIGNILVKTGDDINSMKFLDVRYVISGAGDNDVNTQIAKILDDTPDIKYIYSQHNAEICIFNCLTECVASTKNSNVSKILGCEIWGNCYVGIDDFNNDISTTIDLTKELFTEILAHAGDSGVDFNVKNKVFCNIYKEMS